MNTTNRQTLEHTEFRQTQFHIRRCEANRKKEGRIKVLIVLPNSIEKFLRTSGV